MRIIRWDPMTQWSQQTSRERIVTHAAVNQQPKFLASKNQLTNRKNKWGKKSMRNGAKRHTDILLGIIRDY